MAGPDPLPRHPVPPQVCIGSAAGVAWYPPASFEAWKRTDSPVLAGLPTWDDWFDTYRQAFARLRDEGIRPYKVVVEAAALAAWLAEHGRPDGADSRAEYVDFRFRRLLAEIAP